LPKKALPEIRNLEKTDSEIIKITDRIEWSQSLQAVKWEFR